MEGKTVEMWIKKEEEKGKGMIKSEVFTVGFGVRKIEATYTYDDLIASQWVREVMRMYQKCVRARPGCSLIAGICSFRGENFSRSKKSDNWISLISICVFGSHCLVLPIDDYGDHSCPFPFSVRSFLADRHVHLVGPGVGKLVEKMERDWDFRVNRPSELRPLVEAAFGKEAVARSGTRHGAAGLEELAHAALGGVRVQKKPGRLQCNPWGRKQEDEEAEVMHATVDAFLACRIGMRSLQVMYCRRRR